MHTLRAEILKPVDAEILLLSQNLIDVFFLYAFQARTSDLCAVISGVVVCKLLRFRKTSSRNKDDVAKLFLAILVDYVIG